MKLLVQKYLETHTFADLAKDHGVYASFNKKEYGSPLDTFGYKWSLNYDQLEAKDADPLAQECRGLILARKDGRSLNYDVSDIDLTTGRANYDNVCPEETIVLAFPIKRFFNYGQGAAADINWLSPNFSILEKLDGTLTILYFDIFTKQWHVATRSVSEANLPIDMGPFTFRTLFEKALLDTAGHSFADFTSMLDENITYCFELTSPYNRIVVKYNDTRITLLAARSIQTMDELDINTIDTFGVPHVQSYNFSNMDDIVNWVSAQNPLEHEGVVIKDGINRIKSKNINYVLLNKTRDYLCNDRAFLNLVLNEKEDDVWEVLPPLFQERVLELKRQLNNLSLITTKHYEVVKDVTNSKKEFALAIQKNKLWGAPLFQMYDGKCSSFKEFILLNKSKDGTFGNSFLDKILSMLDI